ncbi:MAG: hypothetical protein FWC47_05965 [Oscillospiraceae bacterium]|nr:hypothetical protein [Oscillospiraceae bacterium]
MNFSNLNYYVNNKKKTLKIQKYTILFLILSVAVSFKVLSMLEGNLSKLTNEYSNINNIMLQNKKNNNSSKIMVENAFLLLNFLVDENITGRLNESMNESQLVLSGDEGLICNALKDIANIDKFKVKNIEFYGSGSEIKEVKLTFGEYLNEE